MVVASTKNFISLSSLKLGDLDLPPLVEEGGGAEAELAGVGGLNLLVPFDVAAQGHGVLWVNRG